MSSLLTLATYISLIHPSIRGGEKTCQRREERRLLVRRNSNNSPASCSGGINVKTYVRVLRVAENFVDQYGIRRNKV